MNAKDWSVIAGLIVLVFAILGTCVPEKCARSKVRFAFIWSTIGAIFGTIFAYFWFVVLDFNVKELMSGEGKVVVWALVKVVGGGTLASGLLVATFLRKFGRDRSVKFFKGSLISLLFWLLGIFILFSVFALPPFH